MEWTEHVLRELAEPVWPPHEPLLTLVHRLENLVRSFHVHADLWTELDIRMRDVDYAWDDISAWPLDVWNPLWTDTEQIYIRSLKCACNLDQIRGIYGSRVTTVVSMLHLSEMCIRGVPDDWDEYFAQCGAQQYVYSLDDVAPKTATLKTRQTKVCRRPGWECASNCGLCVAPGWNGGPWLCCFTVLGVGTFTAETAMCHVLGPKRSLRPWKNRLYVRLALLLLQQARNVVVDAFDTLLRDRATSFQWVFHLLLRQIVKSMLFGRKCSITVTWKWPRRVQFGATEQTAMLPDVDVFLVKLYNILDTCYITCRPCYFAVYLTFIK